LFNIWYRFPDFILQFFFGERRIGVRHGLKSPFSRCLGRSSLTLGRLVHYST
jgi:hypothetical protein